MAPELLGPVEGAVLRALDEGRGGRIESPNGWTATPWASNASTRYIAHWSVVNAKGSCETGGMPAGASLR
jgi:hypothetical protein